MMLYELRHWNQLPLYVSRDCAELVRWVRENCNEDRPGTASRLRPFQFTWIEAATAIIGEVKLKSVMTRHGGIPMQHPYRARVNDVLHELRAANLFQDAGYFRYGLRTEMADIIVREESLCELEIV